MESQYLEGEVMEEGQEEWLSEGILTDEDYNPASQHSQDSQQTEPDCSDTNIQTEPDCSDSNIANQDETMNSASADDSQGQDNTQYMETNDSNIEETLNNLENSENNNQPSDFPEELNAFLIRKTDGKIIGSEEPKKESDIDESVKQSDDDGNDTDDLLRVLGDGDQSKKQVKTEKGEIKAEHEDSTDDDDNYIFEGKKEKTSRASKTVQERVTAMKAEPEDDATDCSSEETEVVRKVYTFRKSNATPPISTNDKQGNITISPLKKKAQPTKQIVKKIVEVPITKRNKYGELMKTKPVIVKRPPDSERRQYVNKRASGQPLLVQHLRTHREQIKQKDVTKTSIKIEKPESKQRLMKPEEMDEEVPSDDDSDSDEEDLYSELPSSDSDTEDWFTLDIRSERAGEYIPLLGDKAYQLLSEEKRRVRSRLDNLKSSLSALSTGGRDLADKLREATKTVAELDAMLKVV